MAGVESVRTNLNVGDAERGEAGDAGARDAGRLEVEHGLEASLQICYGRGHCDVMGCSGNLGVKGEEQVHAYAAEAGEQSDQARNQKQLAQAESSRDV